MKVLAENYKGIEYIRISKLPVDQRKLFAQALPTDNIIKILRDTELMTDCVQYRHYEAWYDQHYKQATSPQPVQEKEVPGKPPLIPYPLRDNL